MSNQRDRDRNTRTPLITEPAQIFNPALPAQSDDQDVRTENVAPDEPQSAPAVQISVRDWAHKQAARVGMETAHAFAAGWPTDTATEAELLPALEAFRSRVV